MVRMLESDMLIEGSFRAVFLFARLDWALKVPCDLIGRAPNPFMLASILITIGVLLGFQTLRILLINFPGSYSLSGLLDTLFQINDLFRYCADLMIKILILIFLAQNGKYTFYRLPFNVYPIEEPSNISRGEISQDQLHPVRR